MRNDSLSPSSRPASRSAGRWLSWACRAGLRPRRGMASRCSGGASRRTSEGFPERSAARPMASRAWRTAGSTTLAGVEAADDAKLPDGFRRIAPHSQDLRRLHTSRPCFLDIQGWSALSAASGCPIRGGRSPMGRRSWSDTAGASTRRQSSGLIEIWIPLKG